MNVLILSAAAKVLLVRAFREAAGACGGRVIAADVTPDNAALFEADEPLILPRSDAPDFPEAVVAACHAHSVRLVVPTRDAELETLALLKPRLADHEVTVLVASPEAIAICRDKRRFAAFCAAQGLETPRAYAPGEAPDRYPVFVRPVSGAGGAQARRIDRAEDLPDDPGLLVQVFDAAPEFTIDVLLDLEGRPLQAVARQRLSIRAGEAVKSRVVAAPELTNPAMRLCAALGLVGHNVVQAFWEPGAPAAVHRDQPPVRRRLEPLDPGGPGLARADPDDADRLAEGGDPAADPLWPHHAALCRGPDRHRRGTGRARRPIRVMTRALLLDMDDTLYEERSYVLSGFRAVAEEIHAHFPHADADAVFAHLAETLESQGRGKLFDGALLAFRIEATPELVERLVAAYRHHTPDVALWPGVADTLAELRKSWKLAIVTDGLHAMQARKAEALGLADLVDTVVFCWEHEAPKPDPQGFRLALKRLGAEAADAVVVGDNPLHDIAAARAIGARSVRVRTGRFAALDAPRWRADAEAASFADVPDALARLGFDR
ncbi:HAD-IA family hydrolase [Phenylobacterium sp. J367]|uniref:HAD-IA family hydrolase n=1 Tax=Phenylobacterium sp. J367 TaxID=2898435 RepID=UPI00215175E6|nr:HAD-IA family hydrolase [Phenylobacterium sp. J367]MCR5878705.1 HAD-IA family hydrolase [Phenylobacterium sp. J367]